MAMSMNKSGGFKYPLRKANRSLIRLTVIFSASIATDTYSRPNLSRVLPAGRTS